MDAVQRLKELVLIIDKDIPKLMKENRSAGKRARKALLEMSKIIIPLRDDILKEQKKIPKRPKKNNNEIYLNRKKNVIP